MKGSGLCLGLKSRQSSGVNVACVSSLRQNMLDGSEGEMTNQ